MASIRVKHWLMTLLFLFQSLSSLEGEAPVLLVIGTRPEAIKMYPVYRALKEENIPTVLCSTGQHIQMVNDVLSLFQIQADYEFNIMKPGQDLFYITESVLKESKGLMEKIKPSLVVVQGDTTTALAAALAAFYLQIPIAHVEAGLRTGNIKAPFPEELNRKWIASIASYHFAPTSLSVNNLISEGVNPETIYCSGNTVVDALLAVKEKIKKQELIPSKDLVETINRIRSQKEKIFLLTAHRRESHDGGLNQIFTAVKNSIAKHSDIHFIYPMHPNPLIKKVALEAGLYDTPRLEIISPLCYHDMVYLLDSIDIAVTDSGGIQEEAVSLNKPTLVLRNETDRPEGIKEGVAVLVGTSAEKIEKQIDYFTENLTKNADLKVSPYGDGEAGKRIAKIIKQVLNTKDR